MAGPYSLMSGALSGGGAAAAVPGVGQVLGGIQAISGIAGLLGGSKGASAAAAQARKLTKAQRQILEEALKQLRANNPMLDQLRTSAGGLVNPITQDAQAAYQSAQEYDPATEDSALMRSYDIGARDSLNKDLSSATLPASLRGFTSGTGDSDRAGLIKDVLSRRSSMRGQYASSLAGTRRERKDAVTGRASDRLARGFSLLDPTGRTISQAGALQGPASGFGNLAQGYQAKADAFDPSPYISQISSGVNAFMKKKPWQI